MKRMCLAALTGALAISTMAVAIDVASAATRGGVYRGGVNRVGVGRVGVNRVGVGRVGMGRVGIGYGRAGIGYGRGPVTGPDMAWAIDLATAWRPGCGCGGAALGSAAYYGERWLSTATRAVATCCLRER